MYQINSKFLLRQKTLYLLFSLILNHFFAAAQNLVPDPSFEKTTNPQCSYTLKPEDFELLTYHWTLPNLGTSDLFSTTVDSTCLMHCFSKSNARLGHQKPRTGKNMAGIITYYKVPSFPDVSDYREYLQIKLSEPLIVGQTYNIEFFVSKAERSRYACNNIGAYLSETKINLDSDLQLPFNPQVVELNTISDTLNWVKISGSTTIKSQAEYLIIGNFSNDKETTKTTTYNGDANFYVWPSAYYFIDDITVEKRHTPLNKEITLNVCQGDSIHLASLVTQPNTWVDQDKPNEVLSTDSILSMLVENNLVYIAYGLSDTTKYLIKVKPRIDELNIGPDTVILCRGETIELVDSSCTIDIYLWQNGSNEPIYVVDEEGVYWLEVSNYCDTIRDSTTAFFKACDCNIFIPNAFTPNGDSINDYFKPIMSCNLDSYHLQIYNRWGERLFESYDQNQKWDGKYKGKPVPQGVYFWVLLRADWSSESRGITPREGTITVLN